MACRRKAVDILWDTDEDVIEQYSLPMEIDIPDDIGSDDIGDYLSDVTGYCHYGFSVEKY